MADKSCKQVLVVHHLCVNPILARTYLWVKQVATRQQGRHPTWSTQGCHRCLPWPGIQVSGVASALPRLESDHAILAVGHSCPYSQVRSCRWRRCQRWGLGGWVSPFTLKNWLVPQKDMYWSAFDCVPQKLHESLPSMAKASLQGRSAAAAHGKGEGGAFQAQSNLARCGFHLCT